MMTDERTRSSDLASVIAWGIAEHGEEHGAKLIDEALAAERERCRKVVDGLIDSEAPRAQRHTPGGIDSEEYEIGIMRGLALGANAISDLDRGDSDD